MSDQQFRELLTPVLARVQAIAATRPDLKDSECQASVKLDCDGELRFSVSIFYNKNNNCVSTNESTVDGAITRLVFRLSQVPKSPTREELIAQKKAELAALGGGQS